MLKCSHDCSYPDVFEDGICVDYCFKYKFIYNGTCISDCPRGANNLYTNKTHFNSTFCVTSCPDQMFYIGKVCVELCPDGMFVSTHTCVGKCPAKQPLFEEIHINLVGYGLYIAVRYFNCTSTCSRASDCFCPEKTPYLFLNSCFESCPRLGMLVRHNSGNTECVEDCNEDEVKFNSTCAITCPSDSCHIFNKTCHRTCPAGYFGKAFQTQVGPNGSYQTYKCIQKCPYNLFIDDNKHCVSRCPNLKIGNKCLDMCPTNAPFISRVYYPNSKECTAYCPRYIFNSTCVSTCPKLQFGNKCLDMCPTNAPFINDRECTAQCPRYIFNNTCVEGCPKEQQYVIKTVNGTCLSGCPREYKLTRKIDALFFHFKTVVYEPHENYVCLQECRPDELLYNSTCVSQCPQEANYAVNKSCISTSCSPSYMFENLDTIYCGQNCPNETFYLSSNYCVKRCPANKPFISKNMTCLDKCPFISRHLHNHVCSDTCSEQDLLKNGSCISIKDCKLPNVVYKTECMEYCPGLYIANFNDNQCQSSMAVIITSVCIGIILIGFVVWKRIPIANFLEVTKNAVLLLVKGDKFDMALYDTYIPSRPIHKRTKINRGSAGRINSEDGIPLLDVGRSYWEDDEHEDSGRGEVNIDISDLIIAHGSNELGEIESEV